MNIELARTFLEVVSTGSLARAADKLYVTHSTVTMRIKALEDSLRQQLLIRNRTGVSMTAAGTRFHKFAEALVQTWQTARRQMLLASDFTGILSIGADQNLWDDLMFDWVRLMRREHPEIAIRGEGGHSEYLLNRLFQGWLDLAIVYEPRTISGFVCEPLFDDPLVIAATSDRDLREKWDPAYTEIVWGEDVYAQEEKIWGEYSETPAISVMGASLGYRLVMEFGGSVLMPVRVLNSGRYAGKLYPVKGSPQIKRSAYLIYSEKMQEEALLHIPLEDVRASILNLLDAAA
ncbi:LysR family transcriptional regulator [Achromobacter aloeverae]